MDSIWTIIAAEFAERAGGPLSLRLILQPLVASILAIRAGLHDAAAGKAPFGWKLLSVRADRAELIRDAWKSIGKVFLLAIGLDIAYQVILHGDVLLRQAIILAVLIALIPYLILRGVTTRVARTMRSRKHDAA
ncbi:hypothetical protein ACLF3G_23365 [Falsiroseomonas sp. HC035]|uniref:hypothetical protein n=1 Tax=Falsiroseomonas sp. HC035 TaxID=3390999 RepID=UPI003D31445A